MSDNTAQEKEWTTGLGARWARNAIAMERLFRPLQDSLLEHAGPRTGERVLEIGFGAGGLTATLAGEVGPTGHVRAVDISRTLKALADDATRDHPNVTLELADAQTADLGSDHDLLMSSFGVMFFADPAAALRNMARALRPGGRLAFLCWTDPAANPWFSINRAVAEEYFGPLEAPAPDAPGPFGFQDIDRVLGLLRSAGLTEAEAEIQDIELPAQDGAAGVATLAYRMGPSYELSLSAGMDEADIAEITQRLAESFAAFEGVNGMALPTRTVLYSARQASDVIPA